MPINIEFAPELVLYRTHNIEEARIPQSLEIGETYNFLKSGQRAYWLEGEQALVEKLEDGSLSKPIASIMILSATHFMQDKKVYTKGTYKVLRIIKPNEIYFNGCEPITKTTAAISSD